MSTSIVYANQPRKKKPAPQSFMLGEPRIRRMKASFLVLTLLIAPALGLTLAEVITAVLSPREAHAARSRTRRMSLRELEAELRAKDVKSVTPDADSE